MPSTLLLVLAALLIRTGYACHAAAMVRSKNAAATLTRHLLDAAVTLLAFWAFGWAIASTTEAKFFAIRPRALLGLTPAADVPPHLLAALLLATGILPGVIAERSRFWPGVISSAVLAALTVPVALVWSRGWLVKPGFVDGAGAATLHLTGAAAAFVAARYVGPRSGKFNRDGSSTAIPGHNVPLTGLAVLLQLIGFTLFVALCGANLAPRNLDDGATRDLAAAAATNVLLAAAAGALAAALFSQSRYHKPDTHLITTGLLGALVAISAASASVPGVCAVVIGAVAGVAVPLALLTLDLRLRLDDPTGGVAIHGVGAVLGLVLAPLLHRSNTLADRFLNLSGNLIGLLAIAALATALAAATWIVLKRTTRLHASDADEFDGLDLAEHDLAAYPDFQQTMIKSYHLREV